MVYCTNCGAEIDEKAVFCTTCGARQKEDVSHPVEEDYVALWGLLGFLIPLVGIILWIVWMNDKPKSSRASGLGALISILLSVIITVGFFAFVIANGGINTEILSALI